MNALQDESEQSPSPEPVYDPRTGVRINTKAYRMKEKLKKQRIEIIGQLLAIDPNYQVCRALIHPFSSPLDFLRMCSLHKNHDQFSEDVLLPISYSFPSVIHLDLVPY